jgi:chromosome segregation protein
MLKALELVGFKSFADKTRFEFPPGITVVVGPNGSGKSNVVDAIKWVLGEQSVKSLRGKEMVDVIFNGSGSRAPQNSAETTLTFDNQDRLLPIDAAEVHITRRVYRSGEGEYLINRQACRLRDIRELLAGTGAGSEAYSIIEQGKVDALLQSSAKDRRAIFEEAAGISRFKAKKVESLRRLERVEQNLLRLADIVEEVENRLKTVRMQATKARRYRELTSRLQELRTQVGLVDWRALTAQLASLDREITALRDEAGAASADCDLVEARLLRLDVELGDDAEAMRSCEARMADHRQRIATAESAVEHQRGRNRDLDEEIARCRRQLAGMTVRAGDLQQQWSETSQAAREAQQEFERCNGELSATETELAAMNRQLEELQRQNEQRRAEYLAQMRTVASLGNQIGGLKSQLEAASEACQRGEKQWQQVEEIRRGVAAEVDQLRAAFDELSAAAERQHSRWTNAQEQLADLRRLHAARLDELGTLRQRYSGLVERAAVLEELEQRQEGLGAGVKEILAHARQTRSGALRQVVGLIAELFRVNVETAPLIDVALGELTGYLVLAPGDGFLPYLEQQAPRLPGRVGFVRLEPPKPALADADLDFSEQPGVLGRADLFVETAAEHRPLARRLLGQTWVVERLEHAYALLDQSGHRTQFVTLAGELLTAEGILVVGPRTAAAGLISRRSELRALQGQISELAGQIRAAEVEVSRSQAQIDLQEQQVLALLHESQTAGGALAEQRLRLEAAVKQQGDLARQSEALAAQRDSALRQYNEATDSLSRTEGELATSEQRLVEMEGSIATGGQQVIELDERRQALGRVATSQKVELAKQEERLEGLRARVRQLEHDQHERQRAIVETHNQLAQCLERVRQTERLMLQAASEIAELYLKKEAIAAEIVAHFQRRDARQQERTELAQQAQQARMTVRKVEEGLHAKELSANEIRLQRSTLAGRLRDDYGIELAEQPSSDETEPLPNRQEVDQEIAELRRKVNNIGSVNLDALEELDELERRFQTLSAQYKDLSDAKTSLEQIIHKINADSRRLFVETLENVRVHFQTLFRKLFGGGQADIVLEEGADVLESGIDIIARPPGKEPRNISLLSGGEKTLTCVAMLLAIFKSRPSPFCVLDEVDAALDEANIERFVAVLKEFLTWTQFVVVTHSKKTMACANTLYGVTMQESGISKRVAVRFEDVSENGEIRSRPEQADEEAA